jgi:hypothetical protein
MYTVITEFRAKRRPVAAFMLNEEEGAIYLARECAKSEKTLRATVFRSNTRDPNQLGSMEEVVTFYGPLYES